MTPHKSSGTGRSPLSGEEMMVGLPAVWKITTGRQAVFLAVLCTLARNFSPAAAQDNADCLACHASEGLKVERDGRDVSLFVDEERFDESVHSGMDCIECHMDLEGIEKYPHPKDLIRVNCGECHDDDDGPIATYWRSTHGQRVKEGDSLAPVCQDCHGDHYIIPLDDPGSAISPFNIPQMCAQCHAEDAEVTRTYNIPQDQILKRYTQSIHGEGLFKQGLVVTAVCTSCHTGHNVLPHDDPRSTIHKKNIRATCMQCHGLIEEVHRKVIAGELWEKLGAVPICVECHLPHEARRVRYDTNMENEDCLRCHSDPNVTAAADGRSLYVDEEEHYESAHGRNTVSCAQCHTGASPSEVRSCSTITEKVDCSICHPPEDEDYRRGRHGQLHAAHDPNAPSCKDCHGTHGILEHSVPEEAPPVLASLIRESPTFSRNVPDLCARCHRKGAPAAQRYFGPEENIVERYTMSIHGKGLIESGLTVTATCTDCHSAHKALPASDPDSTVHKTHIPATCGQCHDGIYEKFEKSIHSPTGNPDYLARRVRGMPDLPNCDDCHQAHEATQTDMPEFKLNIMQECGYCHEEVTSTYFDTYHGKATELGDTTKAKCYDCHGAHDILPPSDPKSHLSRQNIVETCAKCHPGSHRRFAGYLTHATHHDPDKYPALFYAFWFMTSLLIGTFVFFGIHTFLWLPRSMKYRKELREQLEHNHESGRQYVRFSSFERKMHATVIISFFGLAITGMTLKFSYTEWAQVLSHVMGGPTTAGWVHRICAIVTFGYFLTHLVSLLGRYRKGNKSFVQFFFGPDSMLPRWRDVQEFGGTIKWFVGLGERPRYGRWTYWEKFDYFAVFWGVAIIGSTGLCLWFPELFTRLLPGWSINVATIVHSDEALLATGFIFTIHFFNTHFRPEKFPMDKVVFTGRMPLAELKMDKPRLYEELVANGKLDEHLADPVSPTFARWVKFFGFLALTVGLILVLLIIYAMVFAYR
jgi:cytochrome b subunit of formate dehydrogenase